MLGGGCGGEGGGSDDTKTMSLSKVLFFPRVGFPYPKWPKLVLEGKAKGIEFF